MKQTKEPRKLTPQNEERIRNLVEQLKQFDEQNLNQVKFVVDVLYARDKEVKYQNEEKEAIKM